MDALDYLRVLRRRWPLIVLAAIVAGAVGFVTLPAATPVVHRATTAPYQATVSMLQQPPQGEAFISAGTLQLFVQRGAVPEAAAQQIGYAGDPKSLGRTATVTFDKTTGIFSLTAIAEGAAQAERTANAFGDALIAFLGDQAQDRVKQQIKLYTTQLDDLTARLDETPTSGVANLQKRSALQSAIDRIQQIIVDLQVKKPLAGRTVTIAQEATGTAHQVSGTSAPTSPTGSNRWARLGLIIAMGLLIGGALALGIERFDTRLRGRRDFEEQLRLPVVASVPVAPRGRGTRHTVLALRRPDSAVAEAYRSLRSSVMLLPSRPLPPDPAHQIDITRAESAHRDAPVIGPEVVLVVSAQAREGKTTSLVNLAATLGEVDKSVIVLDCDFRNPEAHAFLGVPDGRGLSDLLAADANAPLESVLQRTSVPHVQLALAGTSTAHPAALLGRLGRYVDEARELADIVLIDTPPMLLANDATDLMPFTDTVVVVVRDGRTTAGDADRIAGLLTRLQVPVLGAIMVASDDASAAYFGQEDAARRRRLEREAARREKAADKARTRSHRGKRR